MQATLPITPQAAGLRKAAILVACLDQNLADLLLDQMTPEQAQQVRNTVMDLGPIDDAEQKRIIEEFFRAGPKPVEKYPPGSNWTATRRRSAPAVKTASAPVASAAADEPAFGFLRGGRRPLGSRAGLRASANHCPGAAHPRASGERAGALVARHAGGSRSSAGRFGRDGSGDPPRSGAA